MATANDTITRAWQMITQSEEIPTAAQAATGLTVLNNMLHGWAKLGVDLGHISLALADSHKTHDSWLEGIIYNLALRLTTEYGFPVPPFVAAQASATFSAFQAHALEFTDDMQVDRALDPRYFNTRRTGAYDIDEG